MTTKFVYIFGSLGSTTREYILYAYSNLYAVR